MLTIYRGKAKNLPIKLLEKCGDMSLKEYLRLKHLKGVNNGNQQVNQIQGKRLNLDERAKDLGLHSRW